MTVKYFRLKCKHATKLRGFNSLHLWMWGAEMVFCWIIGFLERDLCGCPWQRPSQPQGWDGVECSPRNTRKAGMVASLPAGYWRSTDGLLSVCGCFLWKGSSKEFLFFEGDNEEWEVTLGVTVYLPSFMCIAQFLPKQKSWSQEAYRDSAWTPWRLMFPQEASLIHHQTPGSV